MVLKIPDRPGSAGRIPNEVDFLPAGGLAHASKAGAAVGPDFLRKMLEMTLEGRQVIDHVFFYENFRREWMGGWDG